LIAESAQISAKAGKTSSEDRNIMGEFLNFCPIIAFDGSRMKDYDVNGMLEQLKKVYIERVVNNGLKTPTCITETNLCNWTMLKWKISMAEKGDWKHQGNPPKARTLK